MAYVDLIRARRAELIAKLEQAKAEYAQLEQVLRDHCRAIDMDVGALRELDALLDECGALADDLTIKDVEEWR